MSSGPFLEARSIRDLDGLREEPKESSRPHDESATNRDALEPIAVIGLDLKFPQDAVSAETFWRLLIEGRSAMTEVPKDRFNLDAFYHPDATRANALNVRGGHFVRDDISAFDAPFFSISPSEASCMDPQQRGLLECAYKALENAGVPLTDVVGSRTSVHVGSFSREYETILLRDPELQAKYMATGTGTAMLANRLSWFFNLVGPSVAIDTACSSSLLALHLACHSLRSGESTMGLVAGCNLMFNPDLIIPMTNLNFLSADSKCYSFDDRANGYSRGEGFGVIVIKRLCKALEDRNTIRAVIRATGTNQDGRTPGITQPSSLAQERLIRETYRAGGLDLETTRFFEAHGTGTPVGDPLEARAIGAVFGTQRSKGPLYVGALKSNIGHLEGASGIAGLIKSVLVLEKGVIPPNMWFERPNRKILSDDWNIKFPIEPTLWPTSGLRRASVNSFGFGGSNVHVILDDAYHYLTLRGLIGNHHTAKIPLELENSSTLNGKYQPYLQVNGALTCTANTQLSNSTPRLLVWSASDEAGIARLTKLYLAHLANKLQTISEDESIYFENLVYTVCTKRTSLTWKSFTIADSTTDLRRCLDNGLSKPTRSSRPPRLAFIFTGQGAQWCSMGKELLIYPTFKESLQKAGTFFRSLGCGWDLIDELTKDQKCSRLDNPAFSQPICTALQVALVDLTRSWSLFPSAVVGHSSGEIAAAYCTGGLCQDSAWKVAYYRGHYCAQLALRMRSSGAMLSVGLSEAKVIAFLAGLSSEEITSNVTVGCINSPNNVTLTGVEEHIDTLKTTLERHQSFVRKLNVGVAYHSIYMEDVAPEYERSLKDITSGSPMQNSPDVLMFSTVSGKIVHPDRLKESGYWVKNLTSPVQFVDAVTSLFFHFSGGHGDESNGGQYEVGVIDHFVEIGPHSTLQGPLKDILKCLGKYETTGYSSLLRRGKCARKTSLTAAGQLHCLGCRVDLMEVNLLRGQRMPLMLIDLPGYPFNHSQKYWLESRISKNFRFRQHPPHELLGTTAKDWNLLEPSWRHFIRESESPWICDHKINGTVLYPASGMLIMAIEAIRQLQDPEDTIKGYKLKEVQFLRALEIVEGPDGTETSFVLRPCTDDKMVSVWHEFILRTYTCDTWVENCRGFIKAECRESEDEVDGGREGRESLTLLKQNYNDGRTRCDKSVPTRDIYKKLSASGYEFGPCFQTLTEIFCNDDGEATALVEPRDWTKKIPTSSVAKHVVHPTTLDGIFQSIFPGLSQGGKNTIPTLVPTTIHEMWLSGQLLHEEGSHGIKVYSRSERIGLRAANSAIIALDTIIDEARVIIKGLQTRGVADPSSSSSQWLDSQKICYNLEFQPDLDLLESSKIIQYCSNASELLVANREERVADVELLCFLSIFKTLQTISKSTIPSSKPHLGKYFAWMKHQLERYETSALLHFTPEWKDHISNCGLQQSVFERAKRSDPEGRLCNLVAENLGKILTGEVDALGLLFSGSIMDEYYRWSINHENGFASIATYLNGFVHKNAALNILEIGAGTGSGTDAVMEVLTRHGEMENGAARFHHFTFTDISPSFFEKARERFASRTNRMTFQVLDITFDPLEQGFEAGSYDIILAVNVLHATPNLDTALRNTRKLMKPGGKLILFEICNPAVLRSGFIFGLLPGWWLGTESSRKWGPIVSEKDWQDVLTRNGFSGTDLIFRDSQSERTHLGSAIISTASEQANGHGPSQVQEALIFAAEESKLQRDTATQIQSRLLSLGIPRCDVIGPQEISCTTLTQKTCIFLIEMDHSMFSNLEGDQFANLQKLVTSAKAILWITGGGGESTDTPDMGLVSGFSRCIRSEYSNLKFVTLALENTTRDESSLVQHIVKVFEATMIFDQGPNENEYVERNGIICISRIVEADYLNHDLLHKTISPKAEIRELKDDPTRSLEMSIASPGLLETIHFVTDDTFARPLHPEEVEVEVKATGLNFRDMIVLLGQTSSNQVGLECAGVVTRAGEGVESSIRTGTRVCCIAEGTYKTYTRAKVALVAKIPDSVSFVSAAAIPMAYCTAWYSLYDLGRIQPEDSILIHCGAGGVGQAAIQLAILVVRASNIFVTVGDIGKKKLIMDRYGILEDHIFSSRNLSFADGIKRMTQDRGVDLILNSLGGESLRQSLACTAPLGRFVDIGLKGAGFFEALPILPFSKGITFSSVDLLLMTREAPDLLGKVFGKVIALLEGQKITPSASHVYDFSKLEDAFRLLQNGKNLGKIVAVPQKTDLVPVMPDHKPTYHFDPNATYLISGGLGGLGRSISQWMVARGARNLILLSRSGAVREPSLVLLSEMRAKGINIQTPACDISDSKSLASALAESTKLTPPIKGCIQAAMVLKDSIFENMNIDEFNAALRPKVQGSWNLHSQLPRGMDFFILLSSLNGVLGSRSQSNYGAANTYEDTLAKYRIKHGEKAVSLDIGIINSVGFVAERQEIMDSQLLTGLSGIEETQLHAVLDYHCNPALPLLSPLRSQVMIGIETPAAMRAKGLDEPYWLCQPLCRNLFQIGERSSREMSSTNTKVDLKALLRSAQTFNNAKDVVLNGLRDKLSRVLSIPILDIDSHSSITSYGTDSLVAVELRSWLLKEMGVDVAIFEILSNVGLGNFSEMAARKSSFITIASAEKQVD